MTAWFRHLGLIFAFCGVFVLVTHVPHVSETPNTPSSSHCCLCHTPFTGFVPAPLATTVIGVSERLVFARQELGIPEFFASASSPRGPPASLFS